MSDAIYTWNFSSDKHRGSMWYIIALSIVIGLVIWGFLTRQYGMSFIILMVSGLMFFVDNNSDDLVIVHVTELGIKISDIFYDYSKINSYTFFYSGENAVLLRIDLNKKGIKNIDLSVDNSITNDLKQILPNYITENPKKNLNFSDKMIKILKL